MKFGYLPARVSRPRTTLGGGQVRHRPVVPFRVIGPGNFLVRDGLLDTGADETVMEDWMAGYLGIDLTQAPEEPVNLVGRPGTIACRYATVELLITDVRETYRWSALVGFVPLRLQYQLLGNAGFLEYFEAEFRGADREVVLTANRTFAGTRS
jgi:hypothetical protein